MNKERMLELANIIENAPPKQFHLGSWFGIYKENSFGRNRWSPLSYYDGKWDEIVSGSKNEISCGTTACVAGWAIAMKYDFNPTHTPQEEIGREAAEYLGLTEDQMYRLFYADEDSIWAEFQEEYDYEVGEKDWNGYYTEYDADRWDITNKDAAHLIKRIISGEIEL